MNKTFKNASKLIVGFGSSWVSSYAMAAILTAACPIVGIPATLGCVAISTTVGDKVGTHLEQKTEELFKCIESFKMDEDGNVINESKDEED